MAYVQFYGNFPSGYRLKDLFLPPATPISLSVNLATFTIQFPKGWLPVTYFGSSLALDQGSVSSITFGADGSPWIVYGSAADPTTRFTYANGLVAFQGGGAAAAAVIMAGADYLQGSASNDYLDGYAGDDTLDGGAGSDTMVGGIGDDTYLVNSTGDRIAELYGSGRDTVVASISYTLPADMEIEVLQAASGSARLSLTGNNRANLLIGNSGADTLSGGGGSDVLQGGLGGDTYLVTRGLTTIVELAGEGIDTVLTAINYTLSPGSFVENLKATGGYGVTLAGNETNNTLFGNDARNTLRGMAGNDVLYGGKGNDTLQGGADHDVLYGGDGLDRLYGEAGNDTLYGGPENGTLSGGEGDDTLYGYWNNDLLYGDAGNDRLFGHTGNDTLVGGLGNDILASGEGYDAFLFDKPLDRSNVDTLADFNPWADQIRLKLSVFRAIGRAGFLDDDAFWIGSKAHAASDRIIYDKKVGALFYDPDGTGAAPQIKFAVLGKVDLSAAAFLVI